MVKENPSVKWHALLNAPNEWRAAEVLPECPTCKAKLGAHHVEGCSTNSGQVLPSECPGYVESVTRDRLAQRRAEVLATKPEALAGKPR